MKFSEAFDRRRGYFPVTTIIQPAQCARDFKDGRVPNDAERVIAGKGSASKVFAAEKDGIPGCGLCRRDAVRKQTVRCWVLHDAPV
jgi:hypothetical protein